VISKPEDFPNGGLFSEYVDLRAAALFDRLAISRGWTLDAAFMNLEDMTNRLTTEVHDVGGSVWQITWLMRENDVATKWTLAVNTSNFTPVEFRCESVERTKADQQDAWILEWRNRTQWDKRSDVWFPAHHEYHAPSGPYSRATETFQFDYVWDVVNGPVDSKLFTYETFDLPAHIGIQDVSGDEPVLIRPPTVPDPSPPAPVGAQSEGWTRIGLVITINCLVLIALLLVYWRHRIVSKTKVVPEQRDAKGP
jgi:hypothetical protein